MQITIVHTLAPEVIELFRGFMNLQNAEAPTQTKKEKQPMKAIASTPAAPASTDTTIDNPNGESLTMEAVRAVVNEKAQLGEKQKTQVKSLLKEFGADKFTALGSDKYPEFYEKLKLIA